MISSDGSSSRTRSMFLASQEVLRTIEQNLTNRNLMDRVIRAEGLANDGGGALLGRSVTADSTATPTPSPQAGAPSGLTDRDRAFTLLDDALGGAPAQMVKPFIRRGTRLIDLYVTNQDPAMSQRLAESVGREYIRMSIERRSNFSQESLRYLMEEEERLKPTCRRASPPPPKPIASGSKAS